MSTGYKISFDAETQKFDSQYPIFLLDKQVTPQEFVQTMHLASTTYTDALATIKAKNKRVTMVMLLNVFIFTISVIFLSITPVFTTQGVSLALYFIVTITGTVGGCIGMIVAIIKIAKNQKQCKIDAKNTLINFMENENSTKYLHRGVQFLVKTETFNILQQDNKREVYQPHIVILFCNNIAALTQMMQQPVSQPMYQYMPQQGAPQVYSNAEVVIPMYQQQYVQPQQPVIYQSTQSVNQENQKLI